MASIKYCLLCYNLVHTERNSINKCPLQDMLHDQLTIIFLFRKLLDIPSESCVTFLQYGENPSTWVSFCHSCTTLIENAEKVHKRIWILKADLRCFQQKIQQMICKKLHANRPIEAIESRLTIWSAVEKLVISRMGKNVNVDSSKVKVEANDCLYNPEEEDPYSGCDINTEELQPQPTNKHLGTRNDISKEFIDNLSSVKKTTGRSELHKSKTECSHKCKLCGQKFSKVIFLKRHSLSVHFTELDEKPSPDENETLKSTCTPCSSCRQSFANNILLRGHIRSVHEGKRVPFECPHCLKEYHLYEYVAEHYQTEHVKDGGFPCDKCSQRFCDEETLEVHVLAVHEKDPRPFKCSKCSKAFTKHCHLVKHEQVVHTTENKSFKCDLCPMAFINSIKLNGHQLVKHYKELGLKPIVCDQCNWHFVNQKMLNFHKKRKHFKQYNFFCPHCSKGYALKKNLDVHVIAFHSTEKSHVCLTCEKAFQTKLRLKIHMRRHTNEKIHMCAMCPKIFSERRLLTRHELTAHIDQQKLPCPFCPTEKLFKAKRYLDIHVKSKHAKDIAIKINEQTTDKDNTLLPLHRSN